MKSLITQSHGRGRLKHKTMYSALKVYVGQQSGLVLFATECVALSKGEERGGCTVK